MANQGIIACQRCGNKVRSADQRTCPHCLEALELKRFASDDAHAAYVHSRQQAGAHVEPIKRPKRKGVQGAFIFSAILLLTAGGGLLLGAVSQGGVIPGLSALSEAIIPLAMGAALLAVAYGYGRQSS